MTRYMDLLDRLIQRVHVRDATGRAIERGYVSDLLSAHTALFGTIGGDSAKVELSPELWSNAILPAVAIWKNRV